MFLSRQFGYTPLICAASEGHTDCVRLLLENGAGTSAQTNVRDAWASDRGGFVRKQRGGWSALLLAASGGHTDCVRLLVEAGADKDARDVVRYIDTLFLSKCEFLWLVLF